MNDAKLSVAVLTKRVNKLDPTLNATYQQIWNHTLAGRIPEASEDNIPLILTKLRQMKSRRAA
jgi:hypothetical protein